MKYENAKPSMLTWKEQEISFIVLYVYLRQRCIVNFKQPNIFYFFLKKKDNSNLQFILSIDLI